MPFECEHCDREFTTKRGLNNHLSTSKCAARAQASQRVADNEEYEATLPLDFLISKSFGIDLIKSPNSQKRGASSKRYDNEIEPPAAKVQRILVEDSLVWANHELGKGLMEDRKLPAVTPNKGVFARNGTNGSRIHLQDLADDEVAFANDDDDLGATAEQNTRDSFLDYCDQAKAQFGPLTPQQATSIRLLMDILRRKKASLDTYDAIMQWHLRDKGDLLRWRIAEQMS